MANFQKAKNEAERVIDQNYVSDLPVRVEDFVVNYGYIVKKADLPSNIAGFVNIDEKAIYVNDHDSPQRKAFTIAHELGHIVLHKKDLESQPEIGVMYRRPLGQKDPDEKEQEANCFAANLLVPEKLLKEAIAEYSLGDDNAALARFFAVSKEVIGYRRKDLNI